MSGTTVDVKRKLSRPAGNSMIAAVTILAPAVHAAIAGPRGPVAENPA